ncbi:MAG: response regulator [Streptosporangiaceae bacterium]
MTFVLLVDDTESFSEPLGYLLRKNGFEVAICPTGLSALDTFDRCGADIVLVDLLVRRPPGTEICRWVRDRSNVPVIALNGRDTEVDRLIGLQQGADDYVTRPFSWPDLFARIMAALGSRDQAERSISALAP